MPPQNEQTAASSLLRKVAKTLRGTMDAAQYKSIVLTLLYLRFLSLEFEQARRRTEAESLRDEHLLHGAGVPRWIPPLARWDTLIRRVRDPEDDPVTALDEAFDATRRSDGDLADSFRPPTPSSEACSDRRSPDCSPSSKSPSTPRRTRTFSESSPASKARRAGSSTRRGVWCAFSSRRCSRSVGVCTTPAAVPAGC